MNPKKKNILIRLFSNRKVQVLLASAAVGLACKLGFDMSAETAAMIASLPLLLLGKANKADKTKSEE